MINNTVKTRVHIWSYKRVNIKIESTSTTDQRVS